MTGTTFFAVSPQGPILDDLAARSPSNPFATPRYFDARRRIGDAGWVVGLHDDRGVTDRACGAFLRGGRLNVGLTIPSLPLVGAESPFWPGLREFCRAKSVTEVELGTFGSAAGTEIPALRVPGSQRSRAEWVLLLDVDIDAGLGSNHARNVTKARKAGLSIGAVSAPEAAAAHHALMRQSLGRRQLRGESVGSDSASREIPALLESGAGELFQALRDTVVLSSVLILRAAEGGYYHSAGTSPEGMSIGASHFLIHGIASRLKVEGAIVLNLGGAESGSTLARFKQGFGAAPVALPSARWIIGAPWRRWVGRVIELARSFR